MGNCVYSCSLALVELMGFYGLDFCRIDDERSWRRDESAENMVRAADWMRWSDEEQLIGVMIGDYRVMEHIDEIMAIDGLDYVLFGAGDFSVSIGHPGEGSHPKVMAALRRTIEAADMHGKYVCKGVDYP